MPNFITQLSDSLATGLTPDTSVPSTSVPSTSVPSTSVPTTIDPSTTVMVTTPTGVETRQELPDIVKLGNSAELNITKDNLVMCSLPTTNIPTAVDREWSPETYTGSTSGDDTSPMPPPPNDFTKSYEATTEPLDDTLTESPLSSSVPTTPRPSKKGLRAWMKTKIGRKPKRNKTDVQANGKKPRSRSEVQYTQTDMPRERLTAYTDSPITLKYKRISEERKKSMEIHEDLELESPEVVRSFQTTPLDNKDFRQSLMYQQLKYKLLIVLQNIHTVLPSVDTPTDTPTDNLRDQLMGLLNGSLLQSLWTSEPSEQGVILHLLHSLESLPLDQ